MMTTLRPAKAGYIYRVDEVIIPEWVVCFIDHHNGAFMVPLDHRCSTLGVLDVVVDVPECVLRCNAGVWLDAHDVASYMQLVGAVPTKVAAHCEALIKRVLFGRRPCASKEVVEAWDGDQAYWRWWGIVECARRQLHEWYGRILDNRP